MVEVALLVSGLINMVAAISIWRLSNKLEEERKRGQWVERMTGMRMRDDIWGG